ncbi:octaprenyl-diphosphate synthase [Thiohalophilus thiocyanatoxydans]|uniref:Octaprenyl diphosphate synthase n=2 Tax=Thiohalophilus thiocyanatoxydans TaxID=381308 RepID=A0A4R8INA3_9GAMM|nr:octaprenyl-diphosphate synthase [Thiohalophilus thiocyanatoxydans]
MKTLEDIQALIGPDMGEVDHCISGRLRSEVVLINQIGAYIIKSGGKRLRPVIHLLCARALGYEGRYHIELAAIIEFIHTATLLHDDVVDSSELRRGQETANNLWGNAASVLVGDFLYSRAFQMMVDIGQMDIMRILANCTNTIAEGEVQQLLNIHDADTTEARYMEVIHNKTAKLFESASELAAVITDQPESIQQAMARYGMHLGSAFQLVDDVLDYRSDSEETGKNIGDDLAEGKPTLPLIYAIAQGSPEQAAVIRDAIETGGLTQIDAVRAAIESTGAIDYTARCARAEADQAIEALSGIPTSEYKDALSFLAEFAVNRSY